MPEYNTSEIDGIGAVRARAGTSTAELAGAAAFWNKKAKTSFRDGFLSATVFWASLSLISVVAYHFGA